jgi:hypothetical protein
MFQLFDLIVTSPMGAFIFAKAQDAIYAVLIVSDCDECGFNDLGKLLFGGLALAILVGVGISVLFWRMKQREGNAAGLVSIYDERGDEGQRAK